MSATVISFQKYKEDREAKGKDALLSCMVLVPMMFIMVAWMFFWR